MLAYWESCDSSQGGFILDINEDGLCVRSPIDMYIGGELRIKVFFFLGHEFDGFHAMTRIRGKDLCSEEGWEVYQYELEFIGISEQDRPKLGYLVDILKPKHMWS